MAYFQRVLPRDLFNESKLLKCLGKIGVLIHDEFIDLTCTHTSEDKGFIIEMDEGNDAIYCANLVYTFANGETCYLASSGYNSKEPFPLSYYGDGIVTVLDDNGNLTEEFKQVLKEKGQK